ncbi:hypothetical protein niasHT_003889 [Heterodera trifolii]|uniref:Transmembrane protein n=1 Tax=Heterodera trifolii TaxID=157864 RepID=A0ABD2LV30_9BILA
MFFSALPIPIRCPFLPLFPLLGFLFVRFAFAEVAFWKNNLSEFRSDGSCWSIDQSKGASPPKTVYGKAANRYYPCGDPKYELMRQCQMAIFYRDKLPEESEVNKGNDGSLLFLVDGCVKCPHGRAEANVQLVNNFPSGNWFSGCDEERKVISSVNVSVRDSSSRDGVEMDGTFSLGGILRQRECGGFFGIGGGREGNFQSLMLEILHNCERKKAMLLKVKLPKLDISAINARGKMAELRGISVDLDISKGGWDVQWVDYEKVRPKQTVPEQPQNEDGTFGARRTMETQAEPPEHKAAQRGEKAEEKPKDGPNDGDRPPFVRNASAFARPLSPVGFGSPRPSPPSAAFPWSLSPTFLQITGILLFFFVVLLFGCFVRCFLRRFR